jgi:thymidylate kinase
MGILLELCGLPGSGKTSEARRLLSCLLKKNRKAMLFVGSQGDITARQKIRYAFNNASLVRDLLAYAVIDRKGVEYSAVIGALAGYFIEVSEIAEMVRNYDGILICDEGLLHHTFSIRFPEHMKELGFYVHQQLITRFYSRIPHVMFYLDVAKDVCVDRFCKREQGNSRFNVFSGTSVVDDFIGCQLYEQLIQSYQASFPGALVEVKNPMRWENYVDSPRLVLPPDR